MFCFRSVKRNSAHMELTFKQRKLANEVSQMFFMQMLTAVVLMMTCHNRKVEGTWTVRMYTRQGKGGFHFNKGAFQSLPQKAPLSKYMKELRE